MNEPKHGRCSIQWRDDGVPLDRFERMAGECREHARMVDELVGDLRQVIARSEEVILGREVGPRFWSRYDANVASLVRVADRDRRWARALDEASAREEQVRAR